MSSNSLTRTIPLFDRFPRCYEIGFEEQLERLITKLHNYGGGGNSSKQTEVLLHRVAQFKTKFFAEDENSEAEEGIDVAFGQGVGAGGGFSF